MDQRSLEVSPTGASVFACILGVTQRCITIYLPSHAADVAVMFPALGTALDNRKLPCYVAFRDLEVWSYSWLFLTSLVPAQAHGAVPKQKLSEEGWVEDAQGLTVLLRGELNIICWVQGCGGQ